MNNDNKLGLYITIAILIILVLSLGSFIVYDKYLSKEDANDEKCDEQVTTKTYRFFGYNTESTPDMYTTLKLYSDGNYAFYINNCEGVTKYSGTYTEDDKSITLTGEKNLKLDKKDAGSSLNIDYQTIGACHDSGGFFSLEEYIIGK